MYSEQSKSEGRAHVSCDEEWNDHAVKEGKKGKGGGRSMEMHMYFLHPSRLSTHPDVHTCSFSLIHDL